jgi:MHS family alpha-ketoglutarate permease-like MFS transporter
VSEREAVRAEDTRSGTRRSLLATLLGNMLEWFDWQAYAIFSVFFSAQFFPRTSSVSALLGALAIFAVGFFFRPLGGLLIAGLTDRVGRRGGLVLSVLLMAAGSLLIAVSPTYRAGPGDQLRRPHPAVASRSFAPWPFEPSRFEPRPFGPCP